MRTLHVIRLSRYGSELSLGVQRCINHGIATLPRELLATLKEPDMLSNASYVILAY